MASFWRRKKEDKFSTSVLGLDRSIDELKEREAAAERELSVRFNNAIEKTRNSIDGRLDTIFESRKQIDEATSDYDREKLQERLAKLAGGVAVPLPNSLSLISARRRTNQ